jgi:hypothetical protein
LYGESVYPPAVPPNHPGRLDLLEAFEAETFQRGLLGMTDAGLDFAFAIWILDATRHGNRSVVGENIAVKRIESGIVNIGNQYAFAQVVEDNDAGTPAQPAKCFLVEFGPDARAGVKHQ